MLRSLEIKNFRGIEQMRVDDLGRVNLVIGENDSGKTSLLAAAALAHAPSAVSLVLDAGLGARPDSRSAFVSVVRLLFRGADVSAGFQLVGERIDGAVRRLEVRAAPEHRASQFRVAVEGTGAWAERIAGRWVWDDDLGPHFSPESEIPDSIGGLDESAVFWSPSATRIDDSDVEAFSTLYRAGNEDRVLETMQLVAPHVKELSILGDEVLVALDGYRERMPIWVLGDGARAAFVLAVGLAAENASMLIADEIENGLHFSALSKIWGLLRAHGRDRQVFCTTHQESCIRAAVDAFADAPDELRVIRTQRVVGRHLAVVYDWEAAQAALEAGWEMRG